MLPPDDGAAAAPVPGSPATFEELAALPDDRLDVATGAALIARDVFPHLDVAELLGRFDAMAAPLVARDVTGASPEDQARRISEHVYETLGFRGNEADYYDPKNSFLPDVLDRRLGIPITLALVYCEVARRAGVRARGVGFPGHFLVRVDHSHADDAPQVIDPFFGGRLLGAPELQALLHRAAPTQKLVLAEHLAVATPRATLVRMLINLKWVYMTRGDLARALLALDRIVLLSPDSTAALRERGSLAVRLGSIEVARADLARLLELAPEAPDAESIRRQLAQLRAKSPVLN
jgi:regulator of sirC expression with transglutaminase-like and TPR domain